MIHGKNAGWAVLVSFLILFATSAPADDTPLSLPDLETYRVALANRPTGPIAPVRFRDLWEHPEAYAGKLVKVEGRVARLFRQPRVGEFPPLVEAWVVSPSSDPFCLVFPQVEASKMPEIGASVRFSGTFLKRLKYEGGDSPRVAPLIVGPEPPSTSAGSSEVASRAWSPQDWMMGLGACAVVALVLARRHFARPSSPQLGHDPPPVFLDGEKGDRDEIE